MGKESTQASTPPNPKVQALELANQGSAFRSQGQFDKALESYNRATELDPELVRAWYEKGGVLESLQRAPEAATCYQRVIKLDPAHISAWHSIGMYLLQQGKFADASVCFLKVVEGNPRHARAWYGRGKCLAILRDFDEALDAFDKALGADPKYAPAWMETGVCMDMMGRHEDALTYYDEALVLDRRYVPALVHRGSCLNAQSRHEEAIECFRQALAQERNAITYFHLAESLQRLDRNEEALEAYGEALQLRLEFPDALYMKIVLLRRLKRDSEVPAAIGQFLTFAQPEDERARRARQWLEDMTARKGSTPAPGPDGKYEVLEVLDRGGLGQVLKVRVKADGRLLALKSFVAECMQDPSQHFLFRREAKTWIDLGAHPNVVQAYFVEEYRGSPTLGMEYVAPVDGMVTLQDYLDRAPISSEQTRAWAMDICRGMAHAHSRGIRCHRDLKPSNILIAGGAAKVSDFAVASVIGMASAGTVRLNIVAGRPSLSWQNRSGYSFGTPTHMSPEQFATAAGCDHRSDIYSFGVILYQMGTAGHLPFAAPVPPDDLQEHAWEYWQEMTRLHREGPVSAPGSPLDPVLLRCLQKDPARRYGSFTEVLRDLE